MEQVAGTPGYRLLEEQYGRQTLKPYETYLSSHRSLCLPPASSDKLQTTSHDEAAWLMARSLFRFLGLRVAIMDNQMEKET